MHHPFSFQFLLLHSLAHTHSALRWKPSISLLAFTLQMLPNLSTFREIWVEDNKHCAMSQLIHSAFWRTKMPKYFHRSECARLDRPSSEWFRFESCSLIPRPALSFGNGFFFFPFKMKRPAQSATSEACSTCAFQRMSISTAAVFIRVSKTVHAGIFGGAITARTDVKEAF